jgi:sulfur carrier protein ThiS
VDVCVERPSEVRRLGFVVEPFVRFFIWGQDITISQVKKMQKKTVFDVEIADASGHSVVQMSQEEIAEKATQSQGTWVFVNDQLVNASDVAAMNLEAGSRVRLMPGLIGGQDAPTFEVEIADSTGHSSAVMTQAEIAETANRSAGTWVFVNDQLVNASDVAAMNLEAGSRVRLMPGLIGGLFA